MVTKHVTIPYDRYGFLLVYYSNCVRKNSPIFRYSTSNFFQASKPRPRPSLVFKTKTKTLHLKTRPTSRPFC